MDDGRGTRSTIQLGEYYNTDTNVKCTYSLQRDLYSTVL